jgi:hypothetical protein
LRNPAQRVTVFPVLQVPGFEHVTDQPEKPLIVDRLRQDLQQDLVIQRPETVGDVSLDKPRGPDPGIADFPQRGMASAAFPEPVGLVRELRLIIRLQEQAHYLADQFIGPRRDGRFILPLLSWRVGIFLFPGVLVLLWEEHGSRY